MITVQKCDVTIDGSVVDTLAELGMLVNAIYNLISKIGSNEIAKAIINMAVQRGFELTDDDKEVDR